MGKDRESALTEKGQVSRETLRERAGDDSVREEILGHVPLGVHRLYGAPNKAAKKRDGCMVARAK